MHALKEYKNTTALIVEKSIAANDSVSLAKAYGYLADFYADTSVLDSSYYYNFEAEKIYQQLDNKLDLAKTLLNKAVLQHNESDFLGCERSVFKALKSLKFAHNEQMTYESYNLLGIIYGELTEYKLSDEYYNKALNVCKENSIPESFHLVSTTINNIGVLNRKQGNEIGAIQLFLKALKEKNLLKEKPVTYAMIMDNLGYSYLKNNDYSQLPGLFYTSLKIRDSLEFYPAVVLSKVHLSEYYSKISDTSSAIRFAVEAYNLAKEKGKKRDVLSTIQQLQKVKPSQAAKLSEEYYEINDDLQLSEMNVRNKFARIEFETDEIITQKNQLVEQRKTLIYIALGIILIGVFIFIIRFQAAKNRELLLVQEQQKANEEIYQLMISQQDKAEEVRQAEKKRIAQELHDGVLGKLFGTRMNLGVSNDKDGDDARRERVGYIDELQTLEQELREISHDLNSEKIAVASNFVLMVDAFIETQRKICKAAISFSADPKIEWNTLNNKAKINLYRILQEAFQNINKYANATSVTVTFTQIDASIRLSIIDDGVGFNFTKKKKGIGLLNMTSRMNASEGFMTVTTSPGNGTQLQFDLPLS